MRTERMIQRRRAAAAAPGAETERPEAATEATPPGAESSNGSTALNANERHQMIEQAAYFRAQARGFAGGHPEQDWYDAEAEIDRVLSETLRSRPGT